jgi:hypothetical protein
MTRPQGFTERFGWLVAGRAGRGVSGPDRARVAGLVGGARDFRPPVSATPSRRLQL